MEDRTYEGRSAIIKVEITQMSISRWLEGKSCAAHQHVVGYDSAAKVNGVSIRIPVVNSNLC